MMAATGNELVTLNQLKETKDRLSDSISKSVAAEATERQRQDGVLESSIATKLGTHSVIAGNNVTVTPDDTAHTVTISTETYVLPKATSTALGGVKIGNGIAATDDGTISAIDNKHPGTGHDSIALGEMTDAAFAGSIAIGPHATVPKIGGSGQYAIAIGHDSEALGSDSIAIGNASRTENGQDGIAIGASSGAADSGVAVGSGARAERQDSVAIGSGAHASANNSISIGDRSYTNEEKTVSFGASDDTRRIINVSDPTNAQDAATKNYVDRAINSAVYALLPTGTSLTDLSVGKYYANKKSTDYEIYGRPTDNAFLLDVMKAATGITILKATEITNLDTTWYTSPHTTWYRIDTHRDNKPSWTEWVQSYAGQGVSSIALGVNAVADEADSIAIGRGSASTGNNSIAIGYGAKTSKGNSVSVGAESRTEGLNSTALGHNAQVQSDNSVAIGYSSIVTGANSVAIGIDSDATENYTVSVGSQATKRRIVNVDAPTADNDAATKAYVDKNMPSIATSSKAGIVKPGTGLTVTDDGTLNAETYTLPVATVSTLGGVKPGAGINVSTDGTIDVQALIDRVTALESKVEAGGNTGLITAGQPKANGKTVEYYTVHKA